MRIRRGFLFWGAFFVLLGAVPLAARETSLDVGRIDNVGALWPVALICVGLLILLSRSRLNALAVILAGVVLGALCGTALANGGAGFLNMVGCGNGGTATLSQLTQSGTFQSGSSADLLLNCGSLEVHPVAGSDWSLAAGYQGRAPDISATSTSLDVRAPDGAFQRQEWSLGLPTATVSELDVHLNAGSATVDVGGASLRNLSVESNAGDMQVRASEAVIGDLQVQVNAGRARITLGGPVSDGNLQANAGSIDLCVPAAAALSLDVQDRLAFDTNLGRSGLTHQGDLWTRAGTGGPTIHLSVEGNAASFNLDPVGGCQ